MSDEEVKWPFFAKNFEQLLVDRGVSMYRICEETDLRSSNLSKMHAGTKRPTDEAIHQLAGFKPLDISFLELVRWRVMDEYGPEAAAIPEKLTEFGITPENFHLALDLVEKEKNQRKSKRNV